MAIEINAERLMKEGGDKVNQLENQSISQVRALQESHERPSVNRGTS